MMSWLLSTIVEWDFLALIYLLSVCRCWRFVLDPVVAETSLTFAWCTLFFFMMCGDGCILRTHKVPSKGVVYVLSLV